jgi:hypothetical protein
MRNLYLDIDGVLLKKDGSPSNYLDKFLEYVTENCNCYWLTTHARDGSNRVVQHFRDKVSDNTLLLLNSIRPTNWSTYKTEAINFNEDFLWLDDNLFLREKQDLEDNNAMRKFEWFDLRERPDQLLKVMNRIQLGI